VPVFGLCLPFFFDYKFSEEGISIVVFFGTIKVDFIPIENIKCAKMTSLFSTAGHFAVRLGNRLKLRVVLVEVDNKKPRFWVLTPRNPDKEVLRLNFPSSK
jgi:hypothetical protein